MSAYDFAAQRLFVEADLAGTAMILLDRAQANYLLNVLRLKAGDEVLVFNGRDGEWLARLEPEGRKSARLACQRRIRAQMARSDLDYLFAPLKHARLDYMAQKAVEMGAGRLIPVITRRTQATRLNLERLKANVIEAAEQCGVLALPETMAERRLETALSEMDAGRRLIFCDEDAGIADPLVALGSVEPGPLAVLIGPEGGFAPEERALLLGRPGTLRLSLGPRILRADTAAVAALALVQAALGDWRRSG